MRFVFRSKCRRDAKTGAERELFSQLISEIETLAAAMGIKYEKSLVKINLDILDALSPDAPP